VCWAYIDSATGDRRGVVVCLIDSATDVKRSGAKLSSRNEQHKMDQIIADTRN
jgi:hypothetical protein